MGSNLDCEGLGRFATAPQSRGIMPTEHFHVQRMVPLRTKQMVGCLQADTARHCSRDTATEQSPPDRVLTSGDVRGLPFGCGSISVGDGELKRHHWMALRANRARAKGAC